jgi:hypothetical protein
MAIQHQSISDPFIHEPKGVASAAAGQAYVADGAGSGAWTPVQRVAYACMRGSSLDYTTGITDVYKVINDVSLEGPDEGNITFETNIESGLDSNETEGRFEIVSTGVYEISMGVSFKSATSSLHTYHFTLGIDSGSGVIEQSNVIGASVSTTKNTETNHISFTCIGNLSAGDNVYLMVKEDTSSQAQFDFINMSIIRVS